MQGVGAWIIGPLVAITPPLVLLAYGASRCGVRPLDGRILRPFLLGVAALVPVGLLAMGVILTANRIPDVQVSALFVAFAGAALPEEGAKLAIVLILLAGRYREASAGTIVVLALAASLGLALAENVLYLAAFWSTWPQIGLLRAGGAIPLHALIGLAMGGMLAHWRAGRGGWCLLAAFLLPMLVHGIFDTLVFVGEGQVVADEGITRDPEPAPYAIAIAMLAVFAPVALRLGFGPPSSADAVSEAGRPWALAFGIVIAGIAALALVDLALAWSRETGADGILLRTLTHLVLPAAFSASMIRFGLTRPAGASGRLA